MALMALRTPYRQADAQFAGVRALSLVPVVLDAPLLAHPASQSGAGRPTPRVRVAGCPTHPDTDVILVPHTRWQAMTTETAAVLISWNMGELEIIPRHLRPEF